MTLKHKDWIVYIWKHKLNSSAVVSYWGFTPLTPAKMPHLPGLRWHNIEENGPFDQKSSFSCSDRLCNVSLTCCKSAEKAHLLLWCMWAALEFLHGTALIPGVCYAFRFPRRIWTSRRNISPRQSPPDPSGAREMRGLSVPPPPPQGLTVESLWRRLLLRQLLHAHFLHQFKTT